MRCEYYFWDEPLSFGISNINIYFLFVGQIASRELAESLNWPMMSTELDWLSFTSTGVFQFSDFSLFRSSESHFWLVGGLVYCRKGFPTWRKFPSNNCYLRSMIHWTPGFFGGKQLQINGPIGNWRGRRVFPRPHKISWHSWTNKKAPKGQGPLQLRAVPQVLNWWKIMRHEGP